MGILIAYLLGIATAMKPKHHHRQCNQDTAEGHKGHCFRDSPISVVCIPPTLSDQEAAKEKKKERRKSIAFCVQVVTLIVLCIYAGFTILIWCAMRDANQIAQKSLRLVEYTYAAKIAVQIGFAGDGTINVGIENHGKLGTTSSAKYEITLEELPSGKVLKPTLSHSVTDRIPEGGEPQMPNHFHQIAGFTESDLALYKSSREAVKVGGVVTYDNGFGQTQREAFCWISVAFGVVPCDGIDRYLRSLPKP